MTYGAPSPERVQQATFYVDQLAERLVLSVDQSDDEPVQAHRDFLGGIVVYDQLLSGPLEHSEAIPYDRINAGQTITERLNGRYFTHIDPAIQKHIHTAARHLPSYIKSDHTTAEWRTISRLVETNIFDANGRQVSAAYESVDMLRRLAIGHVHLRLWSYGKS